MTDTETPPREPGAAPLGTARFFRPGTPAPDPPRSAAQTGGREAGAFHRDRWSDDRVMVRYIPPLSPVVHAPSGTGHGGEDAQDLFAAIDTLLDLGEEPDAGTAAALGMTAAEIGTMYRLPAIVKYEDRYVIPTSAVGDARRLEGSALPEGCGLEHGGGPGMDGDGPFRQDSGRKLLPLVSVENLHLPRVRQTADTPDEAKET